LSTQYPLDFIQQIRMLLGDASEFFFAALEQKPTTSIRLNPFKPTEGLESTEKIPWCKLGYNLSERPEFIFDPLFHAGAYYVQESSSMFLEHLLKQLLPTFSAPIKILDICAAPGGKSTLISSLLSKNDLLVSNEILKSRVGVLEENMMKWGQPNIVITNNDPKDFAAVTHFFDIIVIDAPCSGEGLYRRDKNAIAEWSKEHVALCEARQQRILADCMDCLKPGGFIVYSTCTYNTFENESNVKWMMNEWQLKPISIDIPAEWPIVNSFDKEVTAYRFLPQNIKGEGFFIACLQKPHNTIEHQKRPYKRKDKMNKLQLESLRKWLQYPDEFEYMMVGDKIQAISISLIEDVQHLQHHLYLKNAGLFMGSFAKNELIPEHHLALSNALSQSVQRHEVSKNDAIRYLRKDNLVLDTSMLGWTVLTYQNLPIGWVKLLPNRLNNYLPSQLRILKDFTYAT
jgi:16S rRNA C967 or C1407 C5-methylase (RsmB/RsmF family)/NOL1/NOP2/fmu family ribosome biogenesis protein